MTPDQKDYIEEAIDDEEWLKEANEEIAKLIEKSNEKPRKSEINKRVESKVVEKEGNLQNMKEKEKLIRH